MPAVLRVFVAAEYPLFRGGLLRVARHALDAAELHEVAQAGELARTASAFGLPDWLFIDTRLPGLSFPRDLELIRGQCPSARIVVVGAAHDENEVERSFEAGADCFVDRAADEDALHAAIRSAATGSRVVARRAPLSCGVVRCSRPSIPNLTSRQQQVLDLVGEGHSNKAIGRLLGLSHLTVRNYIAVLFRLTGTRTRSELAAVRCGPAPCSSPEVDPAADVFPGAKGAAVAEPRDKDC